MSSLLCLHKPYRGSMCSVVSTKISALTLLSTGGILSICSCTEWKPKDPAPAPASYVLSSMKSTSDRIPTALGCIVFTVRKCCGFTLPRECLCSCSQFLTRQRSVRVLPDSGVLKEKGGRIQAFFSGSQVGTLSHATPGCTQCQWDHEDLLADTICPCHSLKKLCLKKHGTSSASQWALVCGDGRKKWPSLLIAK